MSEFNPYASPESRSPKALPSAPALTFLRAFSIVIASGLGFGGAGAMIGVLLGVGVPSYYRGVFAEGDNPGFDPVQVGFGLGLSQGLICGVLVGMVVVLAVSHSRRRVAQGI